MFIVWTCSGCGHSFPVKTAKENDWECEECGEVLYENVFQDEEEDEIGNAKENEVGESLTMKRKMTEKQEISILIDDERNLEGADIIVRNPTLAIKVCCSLQSFTYDIFLMLDHDLGHEDPFYNGAGLLPHFIGINTIKKIQLVTSNPVGRANMEAILKHEGWSYNYTTHFWEKED